MKQLLTLSLALTAASTFGASPQIECEARGMDIDVTFYSPSIVRVQKTPKGKTDDKKSLVVIKTPELTDVATSQTADTRTAKSSAVTVTVNTNTGAVTFLSPTGEVLLTDYSTSFTPENHNGIDYTRVKESFMLDENEPVYGIGQVMDGHMNRRNSKHHLQNENMFTYSPYFMSPTKGYAVYLDNYSISDFTDNPQLMEFSQLGNSADY